MAGWRELNIRQRLLLNNVIMALLPILLVLILVIGVLLGFKATGSIRDRGTELFWSEAGSAGPVQMGLSYLRAHVDWADEGGERSSALSLGRHVRTLEERGIRIAVVDGNQPVYETEPGCLSEVMAQVKAKTETEGNFYLWDEHGLYFRYTTTEHGGSTAWAYGPLPFMVQAGYLPLQVRDWTEYIMWSLLLFFAVVIGFTSWRLSRWLGRGVVEPMEQLQKSARRLGKGDYLTPIDLHTGTESKGSAGLVREIAETGEAFEQARQQLLANERLRDAYESSRLELLAGIAHDLATPLTKIQGYASGIKEGIARTPEKKEHYLDMVLQTSRSMERLVRDLFLLSKLELGQVEEERESVVLADLLRSFVTDQQVLLAVQDFKISLHVSPACEKRKLSLDKSQFQRVLDNLLSNSLKYRRPEEQGTLQISLEEAGAGLLHMEAADNGRGVAEEELPKLFESFYRTDKARSGTSQGSGLGLAITREIIRNHGGKIWAEANHPHGLKIYIELRTKANQ